MDLWLYILLFVVFLLLRVPVAFAMIASSMLYFYSHGLSAGYAISSIVNGINSFPLLAVPLFIFVGTIANNLGIATRLYDFARALLPRLPGNLAYVNLGTAIGFSWISGSALADAASTSKVQIPQMLKAGYPYGFSAGLTASGSLMSTVMPPSIPAVLFAATASISTGALFAGLHHPRHAHGGRPGRLHLRLGAAAPGRRRRAPVRRRDARQGRRARPRPGAAPGDHPRRHLQRTGSPRPRARASPRCTCCSSA